MIRILLAVIMFCLLLPFAQARAAESAYDRVMKTGTLRCGYVVWGDQLRKDPNTGEMSGMTYDLVNAVGRELGLKIDWAEETGWGTFAEGLNTGRYDMMCSLVWQSGDRAKAALLTKPLAFTAMYAFSRADDTRFDEGLNSLNDPSASIAVIEGDPSQNICARRFPNAKEVVLSPSTDTGAYLLAVVTQKADILLVDNAVVAKYNETASPEDKLKVAAHGDPVRMIADVYAVKNGEERLKYLIDNAIDIINTSGEASDILDPYTPTFLPVAPAYQIEENRD